MKIELIKATRGFENTENGLITFRLEVPLYIWTEILTHRTAVRNASSARAMSTDRYTGMGHYTPETFYTKGNGMQASDTPIKHQWLARLIWNTSFTLDVWAAKALEKLDVCKEQRNRVIAPYKYIAGMVTMTEYGWKHFLFLRTAKNADKAMQWAANSIKSKIGTIGEPQSNYATKWVYSPYHIPYDPGIEFGDYQTRAMIAAARISRLSYNRLDGKDDLQSAQRLLKDMHLSPFEHIAEYKRVPNLSAVFCKEGDAHIINNEDWQYGYGWNTYRNTVE